MPTITPTDPLFLADCIVTLGANDYQAAVSSAAFTPAAPPVATFKGLTPAAVYRRAGQAEWTMDLTYVQDPDSETSLSNYLHDNEGAVVPAVFEPNNGESSWSADIVVVPGAIGGAVENWGTTTVSLPVDGRPVRTPAA